MRITNSATLLCLALAVAALVHGGALADRALMQDANATTPPIPGVPTPAPEPTPAPAPEPTPQMPDAISESNKTTESSAASGDIVTCHTGAPGVTYLDTAGPRCKCAEGRTAAMSSDGSKGYCYLSNTQNLGPAIECEDVDEGAKLSSWFGVGSEFQCDE